MTGGASLCLAIVDFRHMRVQACSALLRGCLAWPRVWLSCSRCQAADAALCKIYDADISSGDTYDIETAL